MITYVITNVFIDHALLSPSADDNNVNSSPLIWVNFITTEPCSPEAWKNG